jgi:hypothetical protein
MPETTAKPPKRPAKAKTPASQGVDPSQVEQAPIAVKKTGRPSKYTPALAAEIAQRISMGEPLRKICRDEHMPHWTVMYDWLAQDDSLSLRVARAREAGYEAMAEETLEIADNFHLGESQVMDDKGSKVTIEDMLGHRKLRIETRLKLLACWSPAKYGNKVQLGGDPHNPLKIEVKTEAEQGLAELVKQIEMKRQLAINE